MALPTIIYDADSPSTNASIIAVIGPKLHSMLVSAGWSIEYADSDAIGGGSAGSPAWDKSYSSGALAGTVVYRMPANGHDTEWFVKFSLGWGSAADRVTPRSLQCGTGHDGSGTLTGGGTGITPSPSTGSTASLGHIISVSEDGFATWWDGSTTTSALLMVERIRAADGTVTDDMLAIAKPNSSTLFRRAYTAAGGEDADSDIIVLGRLTDGAGINTLSTVASAVSADGSASVIVGPYLTRQALLAAPPRLLNFVAVSDAVAGATIQQGVDGDAKTYRVSANSMTVGYVAIATE